MNSDYINNGTVNLGTLLHEIGHAIGMKHPDQVVYTAEGVEHNQVLDPSENSAGLHHHVGERRRRQRSQPQPLPARQTRGRRPLWPRRYRRC